MQNKGKREHFPLLNNNKHAQLKSVFVHEQSCDPEAGEFSGCASWNGRQFLCLTIRDSRQASKKTQSVHSKSLSLKTLTASAGKQSRTMACELLQITSGSRLYVH